MKKEGGARNRARIRKDPREKDHLVDGNCLDKKKTYPTGSGTKKKVHKQAARQRKKMAGVGLLKGERLWEGGARGRWWSFRDMESLIRSCTRFLKPAESSGAGKDFHNLTAGGGKIREGQGGA